MFIFRKKDEIEILLPKEEELKLIRKRKNKVLTVQIILIIVMLISIINIILYFVNIKTNNDTNKRIIEEVIDNGEQDTNSNGGKIDFQKLINMNSDTKGWIKYNDDKINYPIVQSTDNNYYLKKTFNKKNNSVGSIFLDYRNNGFNDQNTVIYGHAMPDGSMFGSLEDMYEKDFFDNDDHNYIYVIDLNNRKMIYQVFSYYIIEKEDYYITTSFNDDVQYYKFINVIRSRSYKSFNVNVDTNDKILTLSTCYGFGNTTKRKVVHAKLII